MRLIVESKAIVRRAFQEKSARDALVELINTPTTTSRIQDTAREQLKTLKQSSEEIGTANTFEFLAEAEAPSKISKASPKWTTNPWNPDQLVSYFMFITTIGSGIALGINWRRLGKPEWMWPSIAGAIVIPILAFGWLVGIVGLQLPQTIGLGIGLLGFGANFGFLYGLWYLQRGAYKRWAATGDFSAYPYNVRKAAGVGTLIAVSIAVIASGYAFFTTRPLTFQNTELTITYPSSWAAQNKTQLSNCHTETFECILWLTDARFSFTSIILGKFELAEMMSAEELEQRSRENVLAQAEGTLISTDTFQLDGLPAARRFYTSAPLSSGDDFRYGMQILIVRDATAYIITVESLNEGIFQEHRRDIDDFVAGIDFTTSE
ncbi:MAG TPA: hypothetical protein VHO69_00115 [Phototrophicaceae bacterium]|nr:hypothetical protein [Phototrophicaceae bacterium]